LCKSDKEYLNAETCKLYNSSVHILETFGILRAFPLINIACYISSNIHVKSVEFGRISRVTNIYANLCKKNCLVYIHCKGDIMVVDIKQHKSQFKNANFTITQSAKFF